MAADAADRPCLIGGFEVGARITVSEVAGPRLGNKQGTIVGSPKHSSAVRVLLDGSKSPITLHRKYLKLINDP